MMSQHTDSVGSSMKGSIIADSGSGRKIMSDALMGCQPRIELPSKKKPSLKDSACNLPIGMVVCCQIPSRSTNLKSTILAPFFSAYFTASAAVMTSPSVGFQPAVRKFLKHHARPIGGHGAVVGTFIRRSGNLLDRAARARL